MESIGRLRGGLAGGVGLEDATGAFDLFDGFPLPHATLLHQVGDGVSLGTAPMAEVQSLLDVH